MCFTGRNGHVLRGSRVAGNVLAVLSAVCAFGTCELAPSTCPAPSGPCKVVTCEAATGACHEDSKPAGTSCDPKTACMSAGACDEQGRCIGAPAPNGDSCTVPGGAIGLHSSTAGIRI